MTCWGIGGIRVFGDWGAGQRHFASLIYPGELFSWWGCCSGESAAGAASRVFPRCSYRRSACESERRVCEVYSEVSVRYVLQCNE